jgi:hypothetical protein
MKENDQRVRLVGGEVVIGQPGKAVHLAAPGIRGKLIYSLSSNNVLGKSLLTEEKAKKQY